MTNLLYKYSQRKDGWRVAFLMTEDGKNPLQDKLMVINGMGAEYLVEVPEDTPEEKKLHVLEDMTTTLLKEMEEAEILFLTRESLMFTVFARAIRSQSQQFVGVLKRDKKHDLQMFNNHVDKMVKSLETDYTKLLGKDQAEMFLEEMEDIVFDVFLKFKEITTTDRLQDFVKYVQAFDKESKVATLEVEK